MLIFQEQPTNKRWFLSKGKDQTFIPKDLVVNLKNPDITAINFLYQNYKNKIKGSILNEEEGFSTQKQVSTFFRVIFNNWNKPKNKFQVLILTPEYLLEKWNIKLKTFGGLTVINVGPQTCPNDFDQIHGLALIVSFENIKLADTLSEYDFFSVVIDHFDVVATKLVVRRLAGEFNIGLTRRNFYTNPNQRLQWTMLNWADPGCVGKQGDFYETDNDNFANLRDNYRQWWLNLTWDFCETFKRTSGSEDDEVKYVTKPKVIRKKRTLEKSKKNIKISNRESVVEINKKSGKVPEKQIKIVENNINSNISQTESFIGTSKKSDDVEVELLENKSKLESNEINQNDKDIKSNISQEDNSSNDTIIYDPKSPENEDDRILFDIISGTKKSSEELNHQSLIDIKKQELYSQLFNEEEEVPYIETRSSNSPDDFFKAFFNNNTSD